MKRTIILLSISLCVALLVQAQEQKPQRLNVEEFRAKQEAFLTEKAGLTSEEAKAFFPIYFELQDKKARINNEAWKKAADCEKKNLTDAEYETVLHNMANSKIESDKLELEYLDKFKSVIPAKKIFLLQRAEVQFHRHILRIMHKPDEGPAHQRKKMTLLCL